MPRLLCCCSSRPATSGPAACKAQELKRQRKRGEREREKRGERPRFKHHLYDCDWEFPTALGPHRMAFIQAVSGMRHRLLLHDILGLPAASESVALKTKKQKEVDSARAPLWPLPGSVFSTHFCCGMSWSRRASESRDKILSQKIRPCHPFRLDSTKKTTVVLWCSRRFRGLPCCHRCCASRHPCRPGTRRLRDSRRLAGSPTTLKTARPSCPCLCLDH